MDHHRVIKCFSFADDVIPAGLEHIDSL
jgi:hypothetical protein